MLASKASGLRRQAPGRDDRNERRARPRGLRAQAQPPHQRAESVPAPARAQSGGLVSVGRRGAGAGARREQADPALDRLLGVPLVPRDGARVVRERADRAVDEREFRSDQGRSRGASRPRPDLHGRGPAPDRARRMADDRVPDARGRAVLRRHLFSARGSAGDARLSARADGDRQRLSNAARRYPAERRAARQGTVGARRFQSRRRRAQARHGGERRARAGRALRSRSTADSDTRPNFPTASCFRFFCGCIRRPAISNSATWCARR